LDFYSGISLKQQSADRHAVPLGHIILIPSQPVFALSPRIDMSPHSDTLFWFRTNQSLLFLLGHIILIPSQPVFALSP